MTDSSKKKLVKRKSGFNQTAAIITGAVVGAGVAIAGALVMKDEKNRKNVKKVLTNMKNQAVGYIEDMQSKAKFKKEELEEKIVKGEKKIVKAANAAKDSLNSK